MKRRSRFSWVLLLLGISWAIPASAQQETTKLTIRVILIDRELNPKPVPKLSLALSPSAQAATASPVRVTTGFDGVAQVELPRGRYQVSTPQPVDFQGKRYTWKVETELKGPEQSLELSRDNAQMMEVPAETPGAPAEDLGAQFKRLQNSVFTVWSESGHGTGFLAGAPGLVLTNQHVVEKSEYLAVQFDASRKVAAQLLASDAQKDVAVLWINPSAFPEALAAPLAGSEHGAAAVTVGERVSTIGSPLTLQKILTTGIVSKVEERSILSDVIINPGNSGGPLFNSRGEVVGITTFGEQTRSGPGIAGIVRIQQALPLLEQARAKTAGAMPPSARYLPVEPLQKFPMETLKTLPADEKVDLSPYRFSIRDYEVLLETPMSQFREREQNERKLERQRQKRNKGKDAGQDSASSPETPRNWEQDAGSYQAVLKIYAFPKFKQNVWALTPKFHFQTDFYRMRLLCAGREVEPVRPGKRQLTLGRAGSGSNVNDSAFFGVYVYEPEAVTPACAKMTLELYATRGDTAPATSDLDPKTIQVIWDDFKPFRAAGDKSSSAPKPQ